MNKALIDTDILSDIGKAKDATVAANAKTYCLRENPESGFSRTFDDRSRFLCDPCL